MANATVSIRPSDFVEGGAVPVDRNLTWKECRFTLFTYTKKDGTPVATTTAARINYQDDDGQEFIQHYSAGDPERFVPSEDGKTLVPAGDAQSLSKSSNFYLLMNALINAGFPENKLTGDLAVLDGLYTYNIGLPEPKRTGLRREEPAEGARERVLSVPSQILRLPWEKGKGKVAAAPAKAAGKAATAAIEEDAGGGDVSGKVMALVAKSLADGGEVTRQQLATKVFKEFAKDPAKDAVARYIFSAEFQAALVGGGYVVDGEKISKAK